MLEQMHNHLLSELDRSGRADTVFVVSAVVFDIMVLGVNSAVAAGKGSKNEVAFYLFAIGAVIVTSAALIALSNGRRMCNSYHESLIKMYKNNGVFDYYPEDGERSGKLRNWLYTVVVLACGLLAIVVPILVRS